MQPIGLLPALVLAMAPFAAHAGFQFEATPSAPPPQAEGQIGFPSPYAHLQALPVVHPPPGKAIAVGEGNDVPLRSALLAIVPQDLHITFTDAVSPEAIVSWRGGKPWDAVLQAAVKPLGIAVAIKGNDVVLSR